MINFDAFRRQSQVRRFIRHLLDITTPTLPPLEGEQRAADRTFRCLPVLISPWEKDRAIIEEVAYAVTKDFSDLSVSILLNLPLREGAMLLGFWLEGPVYVLADVIQSSNIGGGFWQVGLALRKILPEGDYPELEKLAPLAARLVPRKPALNV